jgi:hypothetical protein
VKYIGDQGALRWPIIIEIHFHKMSYSLISHLSNDKIHSVKNGEILIIKGIIEKEKINYTQMKES